MIKWQKRFNMKQTVFGGVGVRTVMEVRLWSQTRMFRAGLRYRGGGEGVAIILTDQAQAMADAGLSVDRFVLIQAAGRAAVGIAFTIAISRCNALVARGPRRPPQLASAVQPLLS